MSSSSSESEPRDEDGYPTSARMKLKRVRKGEDLFQDMDSGQRYKSIKRKDGTMLLPVFEKRVQWKTEEGFKAMLRFLACMGAKDEFQLRSIETNAQMTLDEWKRKQIVSRSMLTIKHNVCGEVVETTRVYGIIQGQRIGCSCFNDRAEANLWKNRRAEVIQIGVEHNFKVLTSPEDWVRDCTGRGWCPRLQCLKCNEEVTSTKLNSLDQGQYIGCRCNNTNANANLWKHRRPEIIQIGVERGFRVLTSSKDWIRDCTGKDWSPLFQCLTCEEKISMTISKLDQRRSIGCRCTSTKAEANLWKNRRTEVVAWGAERNFRVMTTPEHWIRYCTNCYWCPRLQCLKCNEEVASTNLNNLKNGQTIGCKCKNKTEKKLGDWLAKFFPEAKVSFQYKLPDDATKFDFHLQFPDGFEVFVELDGPHHFRKDNIFFTEEACKRDLDKETWAVGTKRISVIRLLQDDVWKDRYGWETYLRTRFEAARVASTPKVYTPDNTPEYSSINSVYVQLRSPITTSTAQGGPTSSCSRKSE